MPSLVGSEMCIRDRMLVRPVLTTEIPRTRDGSVDFEALGLKDSVMPPMGSTYRGFPLPEPNTNGQGREVCRLWRGVVMQEAAVRGSPSTVEMHVVHHGGRSIPDMEDVPLEDEPTFHDIIPMTEENVEYIEMAPLPLPCGSGGAYAKPKKMLHPIPERTEEG